MVLNIDTLCKFFGGVKAVLEVSFTLPSGQILGLIGPNGAGKTTIFNCITGHQPATSGKIVLKNLPITYMAPHRITSLGIARTFQNIRIFNEMTVLENTMVGAHCRTQTGVLGAILRHPRMRKEEEQLHERAFEILEFVNLDAYAYTWARNLPYGAQRRLEICRALAAEPELLLLDEPAAGMNPVETKELMSLIKKIRDRGITILLIEHHMKVVMSICDRIVVLDHGEKISEGTPEEVRRDPRVIAAYLGSEGSGLS